MMGPSGLSPMFASVRGTYDDLCSPELQPHQIKPVVVERVAPLLRSIAGALGSQPSVIDDVSRTDVAIYLESRIVLLISLPQGSQAQTEIFDDIERELLTVLELDTSASHEAARHLVGCLLLGLDELPLLLSDRLLALLGSLTGRREGIRQPYQPLLNRQLSPKTQARLSSLFDMGLFSEVFAFLSGMRELPRIAEIPREIKTLNASVACLVSRKGGVGKSTLLLGLALSHLRNAPNKPVCIFDFDISGPVWQYLLSPDGNTIDGQPLSFLNQLIEIEQPDTDFDFGNPSPREILDCVARVRIPGLQQEIGLLAFRDLPRTNRYIVQAIANNRSSFAEFLGCILQGLAEWFELILIDNSPGFDPHSFLTLVLTAAAERGCPIVVSTPSAPDLRGTLLELSDLRLVASDRPPLWIINRTDPRAEMFFNRPHALSEIVRATPAYAEIMPRAPLLERLLTPRQPARNLASLPFEPTLARYSSSLDSLTPDAQAIAELESSTLFRKLEEALKSNLSPLPFWSSLRAPRGQ